MTARRRQRMRGFTLLEMSIVLAIIAVITAAGLTIFASSLQKRQFQETQFKMKAIQQALFNFRMANNRLPCPADITIATMNANFGSEGATPGTCTGANFANGNNVEGMAPVKALGLPDDYVMDGWGRRIFYAVDIRMTAASALLPYLLQATMTGNINNSSPLISGLASNSALSIGMGIVGSGIPAGAKINSLSGTTRVIFTPPATATASGVSLSFYNYPVPAGAILPSDTTTRMTIYDASGTNNAKTTLAAYVLLSTGSNGHGGYGRDSGTTNLNLVTSRINAGSNNADEKNNCDCDNTATATGLDGIFVQKLPTQDPTTPDHTNDFDDIVVYGTRSDLRSLQE